MAKDSGDLLGTSPEFLGAAWFDPLERPLKVGLKIFHHLNPTKSWADC
jgi:hypothetical protein